MGQVRVAKDVWDKLDDRAKEACKSVVNGVFLNEPALDEATNEYVWDDHRIIDDHTFIIDECKKLKPKKADTDVGLRDLMDEKVRARVKIISPEINMDSPVIVTEEQVSPPLRSK